MAQPNARALGDELIIDSATGVDLQLRVAGPGSRCLAFTIDWMIRLLAALAWYTAAATIYNGRLRLSAPNEFDKQWFLWVLAPALAIFSLYHLVVEIALHGRTPGKILAGVRIVTREGNTPSAAALLARNVFRLIDSFPVLYTVGLVTTMLNRRHARIGDLAAGTLLVHDRVPAAPPSTSGGVLGDGAQRELVAELLERWRQLEPEARQHLARRVLSYTGGAPAAGESATADDAQLRAALEHLTQEPAR